MRPRALSLFCLICVSWLWITPAHTAIAYPAPDGPDGVSTRVWLPLAFRGPLPPARHDGRNGTIDAASESLHLSFEYDERERTFILTLPTAYAPGARLPLALNLHGAGGTGASHRAYTGFDATADANAMLVAYPDGVGRTWAALGETDELLDDVGFLAALIDVVDAEFGIDRQRVYAFGLSQGGFMSFRLACELADRVAAVGSVAGLMYNEVFATCAPVRPVPILLIHGTADPVVPYAGTELFPGGRDVLQAWLVHNRCRRLPRVRPVPDTVTSDASRVVKFFTRRCAAGSEIGFYRVENGGHTWPGADTDLPLVGATNQDIDANVEFATFFLRHQLPAELVAPPAPNLPALRRVE